MKSQTPSNSSTPNPQASKPPATSYAPSVPISVYRELAAELQATKAMLDSVNSQNQTLAQENQHLRQEVSRIVRIAVNVGQSIGLQPAQPVAQPPSPQVTAEALADQLRAAATPSSETSLPKLSDELFTETGELPKSSSPSTSSREVNPVWLWLTITLVIAIAFGAGFLLVRPLLGKR